MPEIEDRVSVIAEGIERQADGGFSVSEEARLALDERYVWAMQLDEDGNVIWSDRMPKDLPRHFTASEIASFARWYLEDYPVKVWDTQEGLLVVGSPVGSVVQFSVAYQRSQMETILQWIPVSLGLNLAVILLVVLILGQRFNRSLAPIDEGIEQLARGERVSIKEKGVVKELASNLNQASGILQEQSERISRRDTARTEWIAGVSHDIRTPLTSMLSYAEFLRGKEMTAQEMEAFLDLVEGKAGQIRELTKQLVEWEGGIREEVEDIRILAEQLVVEWEEILEERFLLRIDLNGCGHLGGKLDIYGLRRVLDNLASNVEKYADPEKEVELTIWTEGKSLCLLQRNGIAQRQTFVGDSHRLGLENMRRVAGEGGVQVRRAEGQFEIQVELRIE